MANGVSYLSIILTLLSLIASLGLLCVVVLFGRESRKMSFSITRLNTLRRSASVLCVLTWVAVIALVIVDFFVHV